MTMASSDEVDDRVALVTGAAGDIGRACAVRLAGTGATVVAADLPRSATALAETVARCRDRSDASHAAETFDVTAADEVEEALARVLQQHGTPNVLVNCAGYQGLFRPAQSYPAADAALVMAVNVTGLMDITRVVASAMIAAGVPGSVVNLASHAGVGGPPNMPAYAASKGAVIGYTKAAARDLAPHGIRVNAVSPAFIGPGGMWDRQVRLQAGTPSQYYDDDPAAVAREMVAQVPMRRLGSPEEVAATVAWLASDDSSYITGENILVTGGI
jgi:NAD(P)-dependent dehydrogenase (short-subunit alcohol dehydrogenase family)